MNPDIPVGLATKAGTLAIALFGVVALAAAVINGDHTEETVTALIAAALTLYKLMDGRYRQATAQIEAEAMLYELPSEEQVSAPSEEELTWDFPDDPPSDAMPEETAAAVPVQHREPRG